MAYKLLSLLMLLTIATSRSSAQENEDASAQANNPLANMTALNFHNYYMPKLSDAPDGSYMNTGWVRFAKPIIKGKFLLRASIPLSTIGVRDNATSTINTTSGLGDINTFLAYSFISKPTATVGVGPMVTMPTASHDALGTGKWQGGVALVAFIAKSPVFQFGGLVTWQASFAGDEDRPSTNLVAVQPFYFWQLGKGTYLRGAPIWGFDTKKDAFSVPLALGIGKVVKLGSTMFNLFIEPQYSLLVDGVQPQFQIFTGINLQFMKK